MAIMPIQIFGDVNTDTSEDCCYENLRIHKKELQKLNTINDNQIINNEIVAKLSKNLNASIYSGNSKEKVENSPRFDFWGALIGALLGGIISLGIYKLGEYYDKKKVISEKDELGESINILINLSIKNISAKIEAYKNLVESITETPYKAHGLIRIPSHNLKRVRSFDPTQVYRIFKHLSLNKKDYNVLLSSIDFLDEVSDSIDKDLTYNNRDNITKYSNEFLAIIQDVLDETANYLNYLKKNNKEDEDIYKFLNSLILKYYADSNDGQGPDIDYDNRVFVKPMKVELVTKFRYDPFTNTISSKLKRAGDLYKTVVLMNISMKNDISKQMENIKTAHKHLTTLSGKLNKKYAS